MIGTVQTDPLLLDRAKQMRRQMTEPETRLWLALRGKRLHGVKFSRQVIAGPYILDFCARAHQVVVEVDGDTHTDHSRDDRRTEWLEAHGYRVLRFTNADVMMNLDGVLYTIGVALGAAPLPNPLPTEERAYR